MNLEYFKRVMFELCKKCIYFDHQTGTCNKRHKPANLIKEFYEKANKTRICEDYDRRENYDSKKG